MSTRRWSSLTKSIVIGALAVLTVVLLVVFRAMIPPTIVAFLLAFILGYPVNWIQRRTGWSRGGSTALLYLLLVGLLALTPVFIAPRVVTIWGELQTTLEQLVVGLQTASLSVPLPTGPISLPTEQLLRGAGDALQNFLPLLTTSPLLIVRGFATGLLTVIYVLVLTFWLLKDLRKLQRFAFDQIPNAYQEDVRRLGRELGTIWSAFLRGQLVLALVVGLMTWIPLAVVGMPSAGGFALFAGLMEFLPTIGPGLSGTIGIAAAFFLGSTWLPVNPLVFALIVFVIYAVIAQTESIYLIPRFVGRRVRLHPAVTFVGVVSGAITFGLLGVLLATPVIASVRTLLNYVYRRLLDLEPFETRTAAQSSVRIRGLIAGRKVRAVVFDLDGTLAELDWSWAERVVRQTAWLERLIPEAQRRVLVRRFMVLIEGPINITVGQMQRWEMDRRLAQITPWLNRLRAYSKAEALRPVPGASELLHDLVRNYRLALVSSRRQASVEAFLQRAGLQHAEPALVEAAAPSEGNVTPRGAMLSKEVSGEEMLREKMTGEKMSREEMPLSLLVAQAAEEQGLARGAVADPTAGPANGPVDSPNGGVKVLATSDDAAVVDPAAARPLFESIVAREDVRNLLPYNEPVQALAERLGLPLESILVVSDTDSNLRAGRASGMITVGVLHGLGERDDFTDADLIVADVTELAEWL